MPLHFERLNRHPTPCHASPTSAYQNSMLSSQGHNRGLLCCAVPSQPHSRGWGEMQCCDSYNEHCVHSLPPPPPWIQESHARNCLFFCPGAGENDSLHSSQSPRIAEDSWEATPSQNQETKGPMLSLPPSLPSPTLARISNKRQKSMQGFLLSSLLLLITSPTCPPMIRESESAHWLFHFSQAGVGGGV